MGRYLDPDEPGDLDLILQAEAEAKLADGLIPCAGYLCERWLERDQVLCEDPNGMLSYGGCCAFIADVDADLVEEVCKQALRRVVILGQLRGRRFTIRTRVAEGLMLLDWEIAYKTGQVIYRAGDVFEIVRRFCLLEAGEIGWDPQGEVDVRPSDHILALRDFCERRDDINR